MLEIKLLWPNMRLMPNRKNGNHWTSVHRAKVDARNEGYVAARKQRAVISGDGAIPLSIIFFSPDNRHRDLDNLLACIKPHLDGIAKGLGIDDKRFKPITINEQKDPNKKGFVLVEVENGTA